MAVYLTPVSPSFDTQTFDVHCPFSIFLPSITASVCIAFAVPVTIGFKLPDEAGRTSRGLPLDGTSFSVLPFFIGPRSRTESTNDGHVHRSCPTETHPRSEIIGARRGTTVLALTIRTSSYISGWVPDHLLSLPIRLPLPPLHNEGHLCRCRFLFRGCD